MPRLEPIEAPRTLFERLSFWISERQFGTVLTPLKVLYTRKPILGVVAQILTWVLERTLQIDDELRFLLAVRISQLNGCTFCQDLNLARAVQQRIGIERFRDLPDFRASDRFTDREQAALAFVEEATESRRVSDATFAELRAHFDETQMVELTWVNAVETYFNLLTAVLDIESDHCAPAVGADNGEAEPQS